NNQRRITCRQPHVLAIKDCDRNKFSVERGRAQLLEHIAIAIKPAGRRVLLTQGQRARGYVKIKDALRLQRTAKMKAHSFCCWIEIGFVLVHEVARGDADWGWTRHRNFLELREREHTDRCAAFVFHVNGHERLERFEMAYMMIGLLWNDFCPMLRVRRHLRSAH